MQITIKTSLSEYKVVTFHFDDPKAMDNDFQKKFSKSARMQKNYDILRRCYDIGFGITMLEEEFSIYDIRLLDQDFIESLQIGMHNRWNSDLGESFDPALNPSFCEELITKESLKRIQIILHAIYRKYGAWGLAEARSINLAHAICDSSNLIEIDDPDDIYDLMSSGNDRKKYLFLEDDYFDPLERTFQLLGCPDFTECPNENIKSALFRMPYLLYRENGMISVTELKEIILKMKSRLSNPEMNMLNKASFQEALKIAQALFLEYHQSMIPRKEKEKRL